MQKLAIGITANAAGNSLFHPHRLSLTPGAYRAILFLSPPKKAGFFFWSGSR